MRKKRKVDGRDGEEGNSLHIIFTSSTVFTIYLSSTSWKETVQKVNSSGPVARSEYLIGMSVKKRWSPIFTGPKESERVLRSEKEKAWGVVGKKVSIVR